MLNPYVALAAAVGLAVALGGTYLQGRSDGAAHEAARWQADAIKAQQRAAQAAQALREQLAQREAELAQKQQEAADAVVQVRTEYLPAKTIVRREVAERVVYRDCRVGDGMRDTINSAAAGRPVSGTEAVSGDSAGVSGRAVPAA